MTVKEIFYKLMESENKSMTQVSGVLGKNPDRLSHALARDDGMKMRVETFIFWLEHFDWQVIIQPPTGDEEYVLDGFSECSD